MTTCDVPPREPPWSEARCDGRCHGRYCARLECLAPGDFTAVVGASGALTFEVGSRLAVNGKRGHRIVAIHGDSLVIRPPRKPLTGAQIIAVAGIVAAIVGTVGGVLGNPHVIGAASAVMLLGNIGALFAERKRP